MAEETKKILEEYKEETKRHFNEKTEEIKRHFDIALEDVDDKIQIVSEQVAANTETLVKHGQKIETTNQKLAEHDIRFDRQDETLETIKLDIEFIKNNLVQKVPRDEFAALERRVSLLENKI